MPLLMTQLMTRAVIVQRPIELKVTCTPQTAITQASGTVATTRSHGGAQVILLSQQEYIARGLRGH